MEKKLYETPIFADVAFAETDILMTSGADEYEGPEIPLSGKVGKF